MKKFLSLLALTLMSLSALGATVTFTPATVHTSAGEPTTLSLDGVKINCTAGMFTRTDHYRFYANSTTTITSTVGRITKVEITCTGTPGNSHAPDLFTGEGYTYTPYGYVGTWEGLSDTISLTATAQVRATKIVVTLEGGESQLLPPTFYPDGAEFTNEVEVALYCATQGAEVHYIEGSNENDFDWSTEAIYDGPFVLNRTKTLTAWSVLGDVRSNYVTATFTRIKPTVSVPEFTPASTTFQDSINVTIACPDTTAVIYYSFDEEQWTEYTDVITVKIDANIYAKAVIEDPVFGPVDSEVIAATYTKVDGGDGYAVVFTPSGDGYFEVATPYTVARPGASFLVSNGTIKHYYRIYKNEKIRFTAAAGNIKKIKFVCTRYCDDEYGPGCLTLDEGQDGAYTYESTYDYYGNGKVGIWLGNSPSVTFSTDRGQVRCTSIVVYLDSEPPTTQVATPVIDPNMDTIYVLHQEVNITCATQGATIYYSTDFENWTEYTGPLDVTEDCSLYAYAMLDGVRSGVALVNFKMAPKMECIADANELRDHTRFAFMGNAIVTYQRNGNTWIKDESGYGLIYDENLPELPQGTVLKPEWDAEKYVYYYTPEFLDAHNVEGTGEVVTVTPNEYTSVTKDNMHEYVLMKNQTLQRVNTIIGRMWMNPDSLYYFDRFNDNSIVIEEGKKYDVLGVVGINRVLEIYVIGVTEAVEEPEWRLGDVNHDQFVDIDDVSLLIAYILGTQPEPFYPVEANVDEDEQGFIDVDDVSALISKILGQD